MSKKFESSESSDSDSVDEEYEKYKAAAVDHRDVTKLEKLVNYEKTSGTVDKDKNIASTRKSTKPSLRSKSEEEGDDNELKTTPEFRQHVARKLSELVDKDLIEVTKVWNNPSIAGDGKALGSSAKEESGQNLDVPELDKNFKLFSSSDPTKPAISSGKPPVKRLYVPSTSEESSSDSEDDRLAQAAVSSDFILATGAMDVQLYRSVLGGGSNSEKIRKAKTQSISNSVGENPDQNHRSSKSTKTKKKRSKNENEDLRIGNNVSKDIKDTEGNPCRKCGGCADKVNMDSERCAACHQERKKKSKKSKHKNKDSKSDHNDYKDGSTVNLNDKGHAKSKGKFSESGGVKMKNKNRNMKTERNKVSRKEKELKGAGENCEVDQGENCKKKKRKNRKKRLREAKERNL